MGEALRNVAHLFQLPPGVHKQYLLVKKDGDKARHSSVTLPAKQVHFGQQALPDKPVVPEVVKPFFPDASTSSPRLDAQQRSGVAARGKWRAEAAVFVLGAGRWESLPSKPLVEFGQGL
eukprot:755121-Pyramimonas_sp.AAC.1